MIYQVICKVCGKLQLVRTEEPILGDVFKCPECRARLALSSSNIQKKKIKTIERRCKV